MIRIAGASALRFVNPSRRPSAARADNTVTLRESAQFREASAHEAVLFS